MSVTNILISTFVACHPPQSHTSLARWVSESRAPKKLELTPRPLHTIQARETFRSSLGTEAILPKASRGRRLTLEDILHRYSRSYPLVCTCLPIRGLCCWTPPRLHSSDHPSTPSNPPRHTSRQYAGYVPHHTILLLLPVMPFHLLWFSRSCAAANPSLPPWQAPERRAISTPTPLTLNNPYALTHQPADRHLAPSGKPTVPI